MEEAGHARIWRGGGRMRLDPITVAVKIHGGRRRSSSGYWTANGLTDGLRNGLADGLVDFFVFFTD
jgi:hypothetical protein